MLVLLSGSGGRAAFMRRVRRSLLLDLLMGHSHSFYLRLHASFECLRVIFVLHVLGRVQCRQVDVAGVAHRAANYLMLGVDGRGHLHARRWRLLLIASSFGVDFFGDRIGANIRVQFFLFYN